jgi:type I restriction enzyme, S subunit
MIKLTFKQSNAEVILRAASTLIFNKLVQSGYHLFPLSNLAERVQYGFTASAATEAVGPKFVRITDIQDGKIDWGSVPYCECSEIEKYRLTTGDILFARTGATTGKTYLVGETTDAIFASYLIRLRCKPSIVPDYLYFFFQSDVYWSQVIEEKKGSAQANVNGQKLSNLSVPSVDSDLQSVIANFLRIARSRQDGSREQLPVLPNPLNGVKNSVERIESLAAKIEEARGLRKKAMEEAEALGRSAKSKFFVSTNSTYQTKRLDELTTRITKGESPTWQGFSYQDSGPIFIRSENVQWGSLDLSKKVHIPDAFHYKLSRSQVKPNDVLVNLVGASIGRTCVVMDDLGEANVNQAVAVISPNPAILDSNYLMQFILSPPIQSVIHGGKVETARPNVSLDDMRDLVVPLPSLEEQRCIVTYIDGLQSQVDSLKRLQEETSKELDAMLPSVLDKAFKGEL